MSGDYIVRSRDEDGREHVTECADESEARFVAKSQRGMQRRDVYRVRPFTEGGNEWVAGWVYGSDEPVAEES